MWPYRLHVCVLVLACSLFAGCRETQPPGPGQKPAVLPVPEFRQKFPQAMDSRLQAFVERPGDLQCDPVPTQDQINTAEASYQDYYMSAKRALSLGIPIVNASGQTDYLVIVRDYRRFKACTATDNKTVLHYGQVIRAVIELTEYQAGTKLSLASLAASATLSGKQQYFYLYRSGWFNPKADTVVSQVSGKVFDVENYALYQGIMVQLIGLLADNGTTLAAQQILRIPPDDDPNFIMASARAYAFAQAKDGKSCQQAASKFVDDPGRASAVVDAYTFIGKPNCTNEKIVEPEKSKAAQMLGGVSVK